ncbi:DUF3939 domain-containing protein [Aquibacillus sediminis]|uniref:DUF3939 domain-containing protein n=1 Tax=Aquibacillus sediminis TaxID=2574734 RepID=UPI001109ED9E|nr:DUF3939 domain-containing protein [Aquibacillus sediminis]
MWGKLLSKKKKPEKKAHCPIKDVSLSELKQAIREYSSQLPNDIPLSVLINDDLSINYQLLSPILKAIPEKDYYMSRETYEVFEEQDYQLAIELDRVQKAVDQYVEQKGELPVIYGDPYKKVSFHKLEQLQLIDERPKYEFYITDDEYLITYKKPS